MTPYDDELRQLQNKLTQLRSAAAKLSDLYDQRTHLSRQKETLTTALSKEQADVDRLETVSITALFYSLLGKKEEKLDQEKAEVLAASAQLGAVTRQLTAVEQDIAHYESRQDSLPACEARYRQLLQKKSDYLKAQNPAQGAAICRLEADIAQADSELTEVQEAIAAGSAALSQADAVQRELSGADSWGTFDLLGGGMLSTAIKHSHLDEAQRKIETLQTLLSRFHAELSDVSIYADIQMQTGSFLQFADYFFDGLFVDWMVLDHIHDTQSQVERLQDELSRLLDRLTDMRTDLSCRSDGLHQQLNDLICGT